MLGEIGRFGMPFYGHSDFVEFIKYQEQTHSLKTYKVCVGQFEENDGNLAEFGDWSNKYGDFQAIFRNDNQERIIGECSSMESLVSSSRIRSAPLPMPSYKEVIEVSDCEKMVEIIETKSDDEGLIDEESSSRDDALIDEESSRSSRNTKLELPKLKKLKLIELPELKSIFSATLICDSLEVIHVKNCEKLKRIPIFLPFLESNQSSPHPSLEIIIHPEERWESALEWDHPNTKDALRRFVKFQ